MRKIGLYKNNKIMNRFTFKFNGDKVEEYSKSQRQPSIEVLKREGKNNMEK